jgi:protein required for attachment to host cells
VLENLGRGTGLEPVEGLALEAELSPTREIGADRPGRSFESVGSARHAMENPTDWHREQKRQFAQRVARAIGERSAAGSFDRLVVVAPAATMGDLRAALPDDARARVAAEVVADLTKTPPAELPAHLAGHVAL